MQNKPHSPDLLAKCLRNSLVERRQHDGQDSTDPVISDHDRILETVYEGVGDMFRDIGHQAHPIHGKRRWQYGNGNDWGPSQEFSKDSRD